MIFTLALSQNRCHRERKASHISDICSPGKYTPEHMHCFPGAGKMISSHTVTKTALIQMPGVVAQLPIEFGFNEDNGFRMKDWAGRISALGTLNALPESHRKLGGIRLVPMAHLSQSQDHPWNSKDTEMMMETLKRSQRHKAVGKIQGLHHQSLHAVPPVSPSPLKVSLEACHFRFYLQGL